MAVAWHVGFGKALRKRKPQIKYYAFYCSEIQWQILTDDKLFILESKMMDLNQHKELKKTPDWPDALWKLYLGNKWIKFYAIKWLFALPLPIHKIYPSYLAVRICKAGRKNCKGGVESIQISHKKRFRNLFITTKFLWE